MSKRAHDDGDDAHNGTAKRARTEEKEHRLLFILRPVKISDSASSLPFPVNYSTSYEYVVGSAKPSLKLEQELKEILSEYDPYDRSEEHCPPLKIILDYLANDEIAALKRPPEYHEHLNVPPSDRGKWTVDIQDGEIVYAFDNGPYDAIYITDYDPVEMRDLVDIEKLKEEEEQVEQKDV